MPYRTKLRRTQLMIMLMILMMVMFPLIHSEMNKVKLRVPSFLYV